MEGPAQDSSDSHLHSREQITLDSKHQLSILKALIYTHARRRAHCSFSQGTFGTAGLPAASTVQQWGAEGDTAHPAPAVDVEDTGALHGRCLPRLQPSSRPCLRSTCHAGGLSHTQESHPRAPPTARAPRGRQPGPVRPSACTCADDTNVQSSPSSRRGVLLHSGENAETWEMERSTGTHPKVTGQSKVW